MTAHFHGGPLDGDDIEIEDEAVDRFVELRRVPSTPAPRGRDLGPMLKHIYVRRLRTTEFDYQGVEPFGPRG